MNGLDQGMETIRGADILVIDDDEGMRYTLSRMAQEEGHTARSAQSLKEGLALASEGGFDLVFLDVRLPDGSGIEAIPHIQALPDPPEIIIITGYGDKGGAKTALKSGVWDYIEKPAGISSLKMSLKRALQYRSRKIAYWDPQSIDRCGIVGDSSKLQMCLTLMSHAAKSEANVLINGETGTGKELFARAIHRNGPRAGKPFVVVDCASLPQNLAESILFGHVRGAFTGADSTSTGLVRKADGGTLFLDEIGELPMNIQKSLLRVLQEKRFLPVGGQKEVSSNFRLVCATNRDLDAEAERGAFRRDLLFRIRTFVIELPPLRERKNDIREIVSQRVIQIGGDSGEPSKTVPDDVFKLLEQYDWPGNVRELINTLDGALAMEPGCPALYPEHLPDNIRMFGIREKKSPSGGFRDSGAERNDQWPEKTPTLKAYRNEAVENAEKRYLENLLDLCGNDIDRACDISGLKRARLYQLLKKYDLLR